MRAVFIILLVSLILLSACSQNIITGLTIKEIGQEQAENYIVHMKEYREARGSNLRLLNTTARDCENCWTFIYKFDITSESVPDYISSYEVEMQTREGIVVGATITPIIEETPTLNITDCWEEGGVGIGLHEHPGCLEGTEKIADVFGLPGDYVCCKAEE